jgi:hypothetical protein
MLSWVHVYLIIKIKKGYFNVSEIFEISTHVYIMLTLVRILA